MVSRMEKINFVFLHGGGQGSWVWDKTIAALATQSGGACNALALDVPGCGAKRGHDTSGFTFDDIVDSLVADIEASAMDEVVLVGHPMAGTLMPRLAERRPDLFAHLVFASCSAPAPGRTIVELMGQGMQGENPDEVGWFVSPAEGSTVERYEKIFCNDMGPDQSSILLEGMAEDHWPMCSYAECDWRYEHLRNFSVSYVVFLQDRALPVPWQHRFAERLNSDRVVHIDAGHQGMMTRPQAFAEELRIMASI